MEKYWGRQEKVVFLNEIFKKNRNKKKEYNVFLYGLHERTIFVLIELKCCGDYLAGESRTFNHLNLLFEERTREKIQVMEFQCDNGKHEWWTVLFVHILKKSTPVFYIISCIFDCFISAHLPSLDLLPFPFFWPCLSLLSCNQGPVEELGFPLISPEVEVLGLGILSSLLNLTWSSIPSSSELPPPHYIQWVIHNFQILLLVSCFSFLAFSCHGALVYESDH